jgi:hypothetical protein
LLKLSTAPLDPSCGWENTYDDVSVLYKSIIPGVSSW